MLVFLFLSFPNEKVLYSMTCFNPLQAWRVPGLTKNGKQQLTFNRGEASSVTCLKTSEVTLPCGQCSGCRLERSRQWAMRCMHESSLWSSNCFITLTYDNDNLPSDGSLDKSHAQKFMKRFRKRFSGIDSYTDSTGKVSNPIRYYYCGEYGDKYGRPHYHFIIFNFDFDDKLFFKRLNDSVLYTSDKLASLWPYGYSSVGSVTFESAGYVARYCMKKITGDASKEHYKRVDPDTGEVFDILPEYNDMSRRPGIARDWYEQFISDVYPKDFVTVRGKKMQPPRYYDKLYEVDNPDAFKAIKEKREKLNSLNKDNNSYERLKVRERCFQKNITDKLPRNLI
ncbi:replication initiator protein [Microviridae sp.]|nr:replication initiator protein [Microviridae sp.]